MKPKKGILDLVNGQLRSEVQAVEQYTLWGRQARAWGFPGIKDFLDSILADEIDHRRLCTKRILRYGGAPDISFASPVLPAQDVSSILDIGSTLEQEAVDYLNPGIQHCQDVGDNNTAAMLTEILGDEEHHLYKFERELRALKTLGLPDYLSGMRE